MKHLNALLAATSIILFSIAAGPVVADDSSHLQEVQNLFRLTQMEKKINESIDSILQLQISQNPQLAQHQAKMRSFFEQNIGWAAMKNDITEMYLRTFSEDELKAINGFYITPAGQKVITELPGLVQQRNQLAMQRIQQNIGDLQKIIAQPVAQ